MTHIDNYIPLELIDDAEDFIKLMDENVDIYNKIKLLKMLPSCEEADKFVSYWTLAKYNDYPHALITLYENLKNIDNKIGVIDAQNSIYCLQYKMRSYYLLLKENNMIGE